MSLVLAFLAGLLTSLSPCVLPVLPLVVGGALSQHRSGPLALCGGLAVSFSLLGVKASLATRAFGFEPDVIRVGGAVLLMVLGFSLLISRAQEWFSRLFAPLASKASSAATGNPTLWGNFLTGTVLGAVWSPCSGPALGTAVGLAAEARSVPHAFILMLVFRLAACLPLLAIAYGARGLHRKSLALDRSFSQSQAGLRSGSCVRCRDDPCRLGQASGSRGRKPIACELVDLIAKF